MSHMCEWFEQKPVFWRAKLYRVQYGNSLETAIAGVGTCQGVARRLVNSGGSELRPNGVHLKTWCFDFSSGKMNKKLFRVCEGKWCYNDVLIISTLMTFLALTFHQFLQTVLGCKHGGTSVSFIEVMSQSKFGWLSHFASGSRGWQIYFKNSRFQLKDLDWWCEIDFCLSLP